MWVLIYYLPLVGRTKSTTPPPILFAPLFSHHPLPNLMYLLAPVMNSRPRIGLQSVYTPGIYIIALPSMPG